MSAHEQHSHGHGGPVVYTANLVGLLILTSITVAASYINFGSSAANITIALAIATMKALLVAMFFMHLRWDKPVNAIIAVAGFLFLGIFLMFDLIDISNRRDPTPYGGNRAGDRDHDGVPNNRDSRPNDPNRR